jgi:hypothetical protein
VHWGFHTLKSDVADTLFEILEVWGYWKYYGEALSNKDLRAK